MSVLAHRLLKEFNPKNRGLHILCDHPNPSIEFLAVHGLAADPIETWVEKKEKWNWLENQLVSIIPGARVWIFGYNSSWCGDKSVDTRLNEVATRLLDSIIQNNLLHKRLVFVAHSFGGIVVLKALLMAENPDNELAKHGKALHLFQNTDAILFFGTPFRGTHEWFHLYLPKIASEIEPHVDKGVFDTFRKESEILDQLRKDFIEKQHRYRKPNVGCFQELQVSNIGKIVGNEKISKVILVQRSDAILEGPSTGEPRVLVRPLERNHFNMHNFGKDDPVFRTVELVLKDIVPTHHLNNTPTSLAPEDEEGIQFLSFPEMNDRFHDIEPASPDTCYWLLQNETYCDWSDQRSGLLCIKGKPGAGKSTLMKFAVAKRSDQRCVLATFFFHARGTELQKTSYGLYRSLLHQLLLQVPSLRSDFRQHYQEKKQAHGQWKWHDSEMQDLLTVNIKKAVKLTPVTIHIDALDECGQEEERRLVYYLQDLAVKESVKICFSCRHYPHINLTSCSEILVEKENDKDIVKYIDTFFEAHSWNFCEGPNSEIIKEIREDIINRSSNVFQWVFCVLQIMDNLRGKFKSWKIVRNKIREVPENLNDLYKHILLGLDEEDRAHTSTLLRWVCFAEWPLSPNELRIAMAFDTDQPPSSFEVWRESDEYYENNEEFEKQITVLSGGLAEVAQNFEKNTVQFIHESVNDYLKNEGVPMLGIHQTGSVIGQCHNLMAKACIYYIRCDDILVYSIPNDSTLMGEDEDKGLLLYALQFWLRHSKKAEIENCSQEQLLTWFDFPSLIIFQNWLDKFCHAQNLNLMSDYLMIEPGATLLHIASASNLISLAKALLTRSYVTVDVGSEMLGTPLNCAIQAGNEAIVELLLKAGAEVNAQVGYCGNALQTACYHGNLTIVELLLKEGANVNAQGGYYGNALQTACYCGNLTIVELLLKKGADVNAQDGHYGNALQAACYCGNLTIVELLLNEGANVNAQGGYYGNALQTACYSGNLTIVELLLKKGANVNAQGGLFGNALEAARGNGYKDLVQLLLNAGAEDDFLSIEAGPENSFSVELPTKRRRTK